MELWVTEQQNENVNFSCRVKKTLYAEKSEFQDIAILETEYFGKMLILDGVIQTTTFDEFIYHEMIVHVPMFTHPNPKSVLVIGGGDGGSMREVIKHSSVEKAQWVDIDGRVIEACKNYLPEWNHTLKDSSVVSLKIEDGIKHMREAQGLYDVIIVDCSDPVGPGEQLFTYDFYKEIYGALKEDGLFVQQTESPFYHQDLIRRIQKDVNALYPITRLYTANIPTYPSGLHCFTIGSKKYDPMMPSPDRVPDFETRCYSTETHKASFQVPKYVSKLLK
ncbi:polyamine aminopropyltransferase [Sinanaerobacter chloroacetimidivorans]|uniref:Polyamine aminopropyltransferase n=1 Tax=Sinanaerobacter chloroacetimidivorans TaxID=2818044 RepID=A0A8J8B1W2_9FIRM|nr:polyamine aminopropyltransferase [Sinanaerobacter chloroacetimidivorans]MBR0599123.1 polyamine aminopropyltransferase [Sinanaerobacter chloroacetimidivorans]